MEDMGPCRKCGTQNPQSNQYCLSCGAVLNVSTAMVRAQPKTLIPFTDRFRWRWVVLGTLAILGTATIALVGVSVTAMLVLESELEAGSLGSIGARVPGLAVAGAAVFLGAFALGGWIVAQMSRGKTIAEPALSAMLVLGLLAGAGSALSPDALMLAAALTLPCVFMAAAGGWFGGRQRS
jgi:hypothetical protein